jgi:hyperosmotically inducible periplasmic protein
MGAPSTKVTAMKPTLKMIAVAASCLAVLGLTACSRDESKTVGQNVDKAIADGKAQGEAAKAATEDAARKVADGAADAAITTKVTAVIMTDGDLKVMKVDTETKNGRVTLSGTAPNAAAIDRATMLVKAVEGVVDVDNQLRVAPTP